MNNWKRIIAAAGTAALLISNMGSVTQLTFATENVSEPVETQEESAVDSDVETVDDDLLLLDLDENDNDEQEEDEPDTPEDDSEEELEDIEDADQDDAEEQENEEPADDENPSDTLQETDEEEDLDEEDDQVIDEPEVDSDTVTSVDITTVTLDQSLTVQCKTRESGKRDVARDEDNAYLYELDETASTTITLSNPEDYSLRETDGAIVRVYMQFKDNESAEDTDSDVSNGHTKASGTYTVDLEDGSTYQYSTSALKDGLYCYEFERPVDGDSYQVELTSVYGEDTAGGECRIWTVILSSDEIEQYDAMAHSEDAEDIVLRWVAAESDILVQTAETENYTVSVAYTAEAEIPENAELRVVEFGPDDDEYHSACDQAGRSLDWVLDVAFYEGDEEIEPKAPVSISVTSNANGEQDALIELTEGQAAAMVGEQTSADDESQTATLDDEGSTDTDDSDASYEIIHFAESGMETVSADMSDTAATFTVNSLSWIAGGSMTIADGNSNSSSNEGQSVTIPTQPSYSNSNVSGEKTGTVVDSTSVDESLTDISITYASDPATSNIENQFNRTSSQDGKVLTDKSVVYGGDDYSAIDTYEEGTFGVTLSALGQEFEYETKENGRTPIDVVFVIDTSRSMDTITGDGKNRRNAAVDAVNNAIQQILDNHEANRVGVVTFSSGAWKLMDLGRYTTTSRDSSSNPQYITASSSNGSNYVTTASGLSVSGSRGKKYSPSFVTGMYAGTFTQAGIAMAYELFKDVQGDTQYRTVLDDNSTWEVTRKPVIVLLSDGDPTYCTTNYSNLISSFSSSSNRGTETQTTTYNGTIYGDGAGGIQQGDQNASVDGRSNNKGVLGYYVIQSAVSYKQKIAEIYYENDYSKDTSKDAKFYTIGMGINDSGTANSSGSSNSVSGDHYKRTVLNPTTTNINYLNSGVVTDGNIYNDQTAKQLYKLLKNTWVEKNYWGGTTNPDITVVGASGNYEGAMGGSYGSTIRNPQLTGVPSGLDYSYANNSWFGSDLTTEQLQNYFFSILMWDQGYKSYDLALQKGTSIDVSDTIGTGMEVKGDPVLRLGVKNFTYDSKSTGSDVESTDGDGNRVITSVTTYKYRNTQWKYSDIYPDNATSDARNTNQIVDISGITVTVTTETTYTKVDGVTTSQTTQTVEMQVPEEVVPVVYPELYGRFYYKELPVRLIYKVGLTDEAINEVAAADEGKTFTFYTNSWQSEGDPNAEEATGTFTKSTVNPYNFNEGDKAKSNNTTDTSGNYLEPSVSGQDVTQTLGNNGKLVLKPQTPETQLTVKKVWSDGSNNHEAITYKIIQTKTTTETGETEDKDYKTGTLSSGNGWQEVVEHLPTANRKKTVTYTYRVEEVSTGDYRSTITSAIDGKGYAVWTITNVLEDDIRVEVEKEWKDAEGNTLTENLPDVDVTGTLYRLRSKNPDQGVTVTVKVKWSYGGFLGIGEKDDQLEDKTITVKARTDLKFKIGDIKGSPKISISPNGAATASRSGEEITVRNITQNVTITFDEGRVGKDNDAPTWKEFTEYTSPVTEAGAYQKDEDFSREFTLNSANNWNQYWLDSDLNEDSGYTYMYYVKENAVSGYTSVIVSGGESAPISPDSGNKKITITNTPETTSLKVNKVWSDGADKHANDSVTVHLYQNKEDTGKTVTLDKSNDWTATFDNLPKTDPSTGELYEYTVKEDAVDGYTASYEYTTGASGDLSDGETIWVPTYEFVDGETYLIVTSSGTGNVVGMEAISNNTFAWTGAYGAGTIHVSSGSDYGRYITDEEAQKHTAMQWTADSVGKYKGEQVGYRYAFTLKNVKTQTYAKDTGNGDMSNQPKEKEGYFYYGYLLKDANGDDAKRQPSNDESDWSSIIGSMNDYFPLDNNHVGDAKAEKAQTFYLFKKVTVSSSAPRVTITNTEDKQYELPETGGAGALPIELGGSAAMLTAMFVGYSRRRRDRKEGET